MSTMHAFLSKIKYFKETLYHQFSSQVVILFVPKNGYWNLKPPIPNLLRKLIVPDWQKKNSASKLSSPETQKKEIIRVWVIQQQEAKFTAANISWKDKDNLCQSYEVTETVSKQAVGWGKGRKWKMSFSKVCWKSSWENVGAMLLQGGVH